MFLSCFGKKGTKEAAIGGSVECPRSRASKPYIKV